MKNKEIKQTKYFGGVMRVLHRPDKPIFNYSDVKKEVELLFAEKYSTYVIRHDVNKYSIYRSQLPNQIRARKDGLLPIRITMVSKDILSKRTPYYAEILKKSGISTKK